MPEENGNINDQTTGTYTTPKSRIIPSSAKFHKQTVQNIEGLLVSTGVYNPTQSKKKDNGDHSHRDFDVDSDLPIPSKYVEDIDCAITYALQKENYELVCYWKLCFSHSGKLMSQMTRSWAIRLLMPCQKGVVLRVLLRCPCSLRLTLQATCC